MTTSKYALGLTFTEVGSSLVFDKVLADDVTPDGMPPAPFDSGSNHTTVTGSLSK